MLSGIGPKEHLNKFGIDVKVDLPVGKNLVNHPGIFIPTTLKQEKMVNSLPKMDGTDVLKFFLDNICEIFERPYHVMYKCSDNNTDKSWPDHQLFATYIKYNDMDIIIHAAALAPPLSKRPILLASADPYVHPIIDQKYLTHPQDFEDFIDLLLWLFRLLQTTSYGQYVEVLPIPFFGCFPCFDKPLYECREYAQCTIETLSLGWWHPIGTVRMGAVERNDTVVDERLRVKNVLKLRVCDASIMPEIPNANTNAPSIMIGEKCAQMVEEDNR